MSNRTLFFLIGVAIMAMLALLLYNSMQVMESRDEEQQMELGLNSIRGVEVYRGGIPYTLNFKQQIDLANYLAESEEAEEQLYQKKAAIRTEKIVIYRFPPQETFEITPIAYIGEELLFSTNDPSDKGPFLAGNGGKLKQLLKESTE